MKAPKRGDILHLQFDPATGKEMKGPHYGLVVSRDAFNDKMGLAFICPISQGAADNARESSFIVPLGGGCDTQGNVHVHQCKSLDFTGRKAKFKERAPAVVMEDVLYRLTVMFDD